MTKRNAVANKQSTATPDASFSSKWPSDEHLKLVTGEAPKAGNINIGDAPRLAHPNEPPVLG